MLIDCSSPDRNILVMIVRDAKENFSIRREIFFDLYFESVTTHLTLVVTHWGIAEGVSGTNLGTPPTTPEEVGPGYPTRNRVSDSNRSPVTVDETVATRSSRLSPTPTSTAIVVM
jgi:hypothetical protein